jgi:hypothetical protein
MEYIMAKDLEDVVRKVMGFNKIPNQNGNNVLVVEHYLKDVDLDDLRRIFNVDPEDPNIEIRDMYNPIDLTKELADAVQKYIHDGKIEFDQYLWVLDCYAKPDETRYTVQEMEDALFKSKKNARDQSLMLVQFASLHENVDEIIYIFNKTSSKRSSAVKCGRLVMLMEIIERGLHIDDDLLLKYLEIGIHEANRSVSNNAKRTANMLKERNPALFKKLRDKYDLEEVYDE